MNKFPFLLATLFSSVAMAQQTTMTVKVVNEYKQNKVDEPVVISLKDVDFRVADAVVRFNDKEIPSQLDDMNGDYRADELVFLADVEAKSTNTYVLELTAEGDYVPASCVEGGKMKYTPRVYVHQGLNDKYKKFPTTTGIEAPGNSYIFKDVFPHGAEFESEYTAYRVYVDNRQNIDLYGKKKRRLELADTHFYSVQEHLDKGYGNDVLWAGGSMGCGTLREFKDGHPLLIDDVMIRGQ
ncbi:MAG: DUF4861 domain-containing protein, partial [Bacteroidaceae bacterium]|nr:DUF4861 domain-containing protein [Bacteroidaceae bacterium]